MAHPPLLRGAPSLLAPLASIASLALLPAIAAGQAPAHAQHERSAPDSAVATPHMIEEGREIFHGQGTCFACHGDHLQGGPIAPALTEHHWKDATGGTLTTIEQVVRTGVQGTAMVAHPGGINEQQLVQVAAYVWAVSHGRAKP